MKIVILEFDKPTSNGTIYKQEGVILPEHPVLLVWLNVGSEVDPNADLSQLVGRVGNIRIEDNKLVGDLISNRLLEFSAKGYGDVEVDKINGNRIIKNLQLTSVGLNLKL